MSILSELRPKAPVRLSQTCLHYTLQYITPHNAALK